MAEYQYGEGNGAYTERFQAAGDDAAEDFTRRMLREGEHGQYGAAKTFRVEAVFMRVGPDGEPDESTGWTVRHTFEPTEPPCIVGGTPQHPVISPEGHDWAASYELFGPGGLPERLGSYRSGHGQVITYQACTRCGAGKTDDGGDTDPANGECLSTTEYLPAGTYATSRPVYWSVVSGPAPGAAAVEPGIAGVDVPPDVYEWAAGHGHDPDQAVLYLLVATEDEAGEIENEVAWCKGAVSYAEDQAIRATLAQERRNREEAGGGR